MSPDATHDTLLDATVRLAADNVAAGGRPFGALVVNDGAVVATAVNRVAGDRDPTAHAEILAIRAACKQVDDFLLSGCTLVSSCEPCPMCLAAALWADLSTVIYAADRHDAARAGFDDQHFYRLLEQGDPEHWPMPVRHRQVPGSLEPFAAWAERTES